MYNHTFEETKRLMGEAYQDYCKAVIEGTTPEKLAKLELVFTARFNRFQKYKHKNFQRSLTKQH